MVKKKAKSKVKELPLSSDAEDMAIPKPKAGTMASIAKKIQERFKDKPHMAARIGVGNDLVDPKSGPFIQMPEWWVKATNTPGLFFGRIVQIAGDSDSGKTSAAITAMKAAQERGCGIIYVETEDKTTTEDLISWGVDPSEIILVKSSIAEEAFEMMFAAWDAFKQLNPNTELLVIVDSIGNVVSARDAKIDLTKDSQKPGGKGQINRLALNKMVAKRDEEKPAILVINYTYDNIGSVGKKNAGGNALNLFSSLTYQTSRKGWLTREVAGRKKKIGAVVTWKLFKNHIDKQNPGMSEFDLKITAAGIELMDASAKKEKKK